MDSETRVRLLDDLNHAAIVADNVGVLIDTLARGLSMNGNPIDRAFLGVQVLHPLVAGESYTWTASGNEIQSETFGTQGAEYQVREDAWNASPLKYLLDRGHNWGRWRLGDLGAADEMPGLLRRLGREGVTDYIAARQVLAGSGRIADENGILTAWSTRDPGGFSDEEVEDIVSLVPPLAVACNSITQAISAANLLTTYLGADAGRRVLEGDVGRGEPRRIRATVWFSDLQGYTKISDTVDPTLIIPMLNDYADVIVTAVHDAGGHVLKFLGDGVLAIFDDDNDGNEARQALAAAQQALRATKALRDRRTAEGLPAPLLYLALHTGEMFYGNIGASDRLDFTVVGPAVNEVARMSALCRSVDLPIVLSDAFVQGMEEGQDLLAGLGRFALRGVGRPQPLHTLDLEAWLGDGLPDAASHSRLDGPTAQAVEVAADRGATDPAPAD